jgi:hypothetical protein
MLTLTLHLKVAAPLLGWSLQAMATAVTVTESGPPSKATATNSICTTKDNNKQPPQRPITTHAAHVQLQPKPSLRNHHNIADRNNNVGSHPFNNDSARKVSHIRIPQSRIIACMC